MSINTNNQLLTRDEIRELVTTGTQKSWSDLGAHLAGLVVASATFAYLAYLFVGLSSTVDSFVAEWASMGVAAFFTATAVVAAWNFIKDVFHVLTSVATK